MRWRRIGSSIVVATMTLGVLASAQTAGPPPGAPAPLVQTQSARDLDLTPEQQVALAQQYLSGMDQSTTSIRAMLEQARAARDVVKTLCLNDKMNQTDVASRSARDRVTSLQAAASSTDKDRARHEFLIIQLLRDRVSELVKEANQCIGEEAGFIGESQVTTDIDQNIPNNNPDQLGFDPDIVSEPPTLSSPYL